MYNLLKYTLDNKFKNKKKKKHLNTKSKTFRRIISIIYKIKSKKGKNFIPWMIYSVHKFRFFDVIERQKLKA